MFKIHWAVLIFLFLNSCVTLVDEGNELFKSGLYKDALDKYEEALDEDSRNTEAQVGVAKARRAIIDKGLIEVRMLRHGNNQKAAVDKLEEILVNQNKWNIRFESKVAYSQQEEISQARGYVHNLLKTALEQNKPMKFRWLKKRYGFIIASTSIKSYIQAVAPKLKTSGEALCKKIAKNHSRSTFFVKDFAKDLCMYWSHEIDLPVARYSKDFFQDIQFLDRTFYSTQNGMTHSSLMDKLQSAFNESPFHSHYGRDTLDAKIVGMLLFKHARSTRTQTVFYSQEEIWYETQWQSEQNANGEWHSVPKQIKKSRWVNTPFTYSTTSHSQQFNLDFRLTTNRLDQLHLTLNQADQKSDTEHNAYKSEAGIYPKKASLIDPSYWLSSQHQTIVSEFKRKLKNIWENRYCKHAPERESMQVEYLLRCLKTHPNHPRVNTWFESQFDLSVKQYFSLFSSH